MVRAMFILALLGFATTRSLAARHNIKDGATVHVAEDDVATSGTSMHSRSEAGRGEAEASEAQGFVEYGENTAGVSKNPSGRLSFAFGSMGVAPGTLKPHSVSKKPHAPKPLILPRPPKPAPHMISAALAFPFGNPKVDSQSLKDLINEDLMQQQPQGSGDPEREFELNRGLAIDTLLKDYPYLFELPPDFEIFRRDIVLKDARGFSMSGLTAYRTFFVILRQFARTAISLGFQSKVNVMLMDKHGHDKSQIRLRWKIEPFRSGNLNNPKGAPLSNNERDEMLSRLGFKKPETDAFSSGEGIIEGISVYKLDAKGMITSHTIELTEPTSFAPMQALQKFFPLGSDPIGDSLMPN